MADQYDARSRLKPVERRVIDISEGRRRLSKRRGALVIGNDDTRSSETLVPFDEIESVIVHTPSTTYSNAALVELARRVIPVVCCDETHMPVAWLWPTAANFEQTRRFAAHASMSDELRGALWQRVVRSKIDAQAAVLREAKLATGPLPALAAGVQPGDRRNAEAQAARHYWKQLFDGTFRRAYDGPAPNGLLNYAYAIVRASAARQLCAAGLHPSLGLHHHNRFNAFCLADDLMEPFRPSADRVVLRLWQDGHTEVTAQTKRAIVSVMTEALYTDRGNAPMSRCIEWAAQSLVQSLLEGVDRLRLPIAAEPTT